MGRAITTDKQASNLSKVFTDLDFYRRRYSIVEETDNIIVQFVAPQIASYEEYRFTLLKNSVIRQLKPTHFYRPDYVSYEEYGTTNLWALLLFINDIATIEEFNRESIVVPTRTIINNISRDAIQRNMFNEIVPLYEIPVKEKARLYYHKKPVIQGSIPTPVQKAFTKPDLYYNREVFTLEIMDVLQRYIDLAFAPVVESIKLNIQDQPNFIYGKHYTIIKGSQGIKNRFTWDPRKLSGGSGLMDVMVEGVEVELMYARTLQ